jgi:dynein heavy chain
VLRHFNILSFTELSDDSVGRIFTTILGAFLQRNFGADISELSDKVCNKGPTTLMIIRAAVRLGGVRMPGC